jgi:hypothetical protein
MSVSNEDREAAVKLLNAHGVDIEKPNANCCVCGVKMNWDGGLLTHRLDVLIASGWGPRPTVDMRVIKGCWLPDIVDHLRECGIEVTDG